MRSLSAPTHTELCLEALNRCRAACEACSESRLVQHARGTTALRCLRLSVQCAELCRETADLLASASEISPATLRHHVRVCSIACERCHREIERAGFAWALDCSDACTSATIACATLLATLPSASAHPVASLPPSRIE